MNMNNNELRELASEFIDAIVENQVFTQRMWEDLLIKTGRYCQPYLSFNWRKIIPENIIESTPTTTVGNDG
jgi:hypothetical protein